MAEDLPIDIHSSKLLDWLVSRRHCNKEWQKNVLIIREKLKHAILDMPESDQILKLLQGSYINFFHCTQIIDILRDTEKDTKNFLGYYSSQRMKDWQEIEALYRKDNVNLAEAAQILQRLVQYEIPGLKKQIQKAEQSVQDSAKKEKDYEKQSVDGKKVYEKELTRLGLAGNSLRAELLALAADLPAFFSEISSRIEKLKQAKEFYKNFREYLHRGSAPSSPLLPALSLLFEKGTSVTAYELKYGQVPTTVEPPNFDLLLKEDKKLNDDEDEIDFGDGEIDYGDSEEIDFGDEIQIDVVADETGAIGELVARGEDALSLLGNPQTQKIVKIELEELLSFLSMRRDDEDRDSPSDSLILASEVRPAELKSISNSQLSEWCTVINGILQDLNNPQKSHLFKIRTNLPYVETLVTDIEVKKGLEGRYRRMGELMKEKQSAGIEQADRTRSELKTLVDNTKQLQKQIESEISKKYNNRRVNIMGGINAVLSGV